MQGKEALALVKGIHELYVAKGKQVVHLNLQKEKPDDETILNLLLGPTGNLRAPTLRHGQTLLVGFDEAMYRQVFT